jgi:hypothetical protein
MLPEKTISYEPIPEEILFTNMPAGLKISVSVKTNSPFPPSM